MKKKHVQNALLITVVVILTVCWLFILPKIPEFILSIVKTDYQEGIYPHYDVAKNYMENDEKMREAYGEDYTYYFYSMKRNVNYDTQEGEATVEFWIKGYGLYEVHLVYHNGKWMIFDDFSK